MKRLATIVLHLDLSNSLLSDEFIQNYFKDWANSREFPTTAEVSVSKIDQPELEEEIPFPLLNFYWWKDR